MKKDVSEKESFIGGLVPEKMTLALFIVYIILITLFLFFLNEKVGTGFGIIQILFAIGAAFILTALFAWIKQIERKNPYLGLIIGVVVTFLLVYALFIRYKGTYTTTFAIIGGVITIAYLIYHFFKSRSEDLTNGKSRHT